MQQFIGKNVLITTAAWFYAPDGTIHRSVWGELKAIHEASKVLGFHPSRAHANWYIEIGDMIITGCQVNYMVLCENKPDITKKVKSFSTTAEHGLKEFEEPNTVYISE